MPIVIVAFTTRVHNFSLLTMAKNNNASSSKNKDKGKNKKGPKGKKARAKAKLDRQWGEVEILRKDETDGQSRRTGKYRRLTTTTQHPRHRQLRRDDDRNSHPPDTTQTRGSRPDANGESSEEENDQALSSLLKSIRKQSKEKRWAEQDDHHNDDDDDSSMEMGADSHDNAHEPEESDPEEEEEEDQDLDSSPLSCDPFTDHFSHATLSESDAIRERFLSDVQVVETVVSPTDPSLVWQASKVLLDKLHIQRSNASTSLESQCRSRARSLFHSVVREGLQKSWTAARPSSRLLDSSQTRIYPFLASYADLCLTTESSKAARQSTANVIALHILNHVWTSQSRIHKHRQRLQQRRRRSHATPHNRTTVDDDEIPDVENEEEEEPPRDQGFTRPTVLVLMPTRACCHAFVHTLLDLLPAWSSLSSSSLSSSSAAVENGDRFEAEYGPPPTSEDATEQTINDQAKRRCQILRQKGAEWLELFGDDVNDDDEFKLGISLWHSKGTLKLFSDFYKSDIIIASPLGLKMLDENQERGFDFLSSIEVCYLPRADVLLMQNWDHVQDAMRLINQLPTGSTEIDYSVVRPYLLAGQAQHWRQLIVTSSFTDPLILSLFKRYAKSHSGLVRLRRKTPDSEASIAKVVLPTRQVFHRVATKSLPEHASDRVQYFCDAVLPEITRTKQQHTMVFVASYFDFVSVRNVLLQREVDFVSVTEYSRVSETSRGRARFLQGRKPLLLYTGRAHYFHRHAIKGVRHLIFLGLPECADFYPGLVNLLNEGLDDAENNNSTSSSSTSCLALFTKYDGHALERIVGTNNCLRMIQGERSTFLF